MIVWTALKQPEIERPTASPEIEGGGPVHATALVPMNRRPRLAVPFGPTGPAVASSTGTLERRQRELSTLAFTLSAGFSVTRAHDQPDDQAWECRVAQRVVRFLSCAPSTL